MTDAGRFELAPGYTISRVINGCWQLTPDHGGGPGSAKETQRIFAELVEHGFTTFDCADIYTGVEGALGKFRRTLPDPGAIQIHTKYAPDRATLHELDGERIDAAIDRSLQRLGVERLDLLQIHWWDYGVPGLDELVLRLMRAQQAGKVRLLGATNFNSRIMQHMLDNGAPLVSLQSQYSLLDRRPEKAMTTLCAGQGVRLLPYGVLAGGFLTRKYLGAAAPSGMNRSLQKYRLIVDEIGGWGALQRLLELLSYIANRHDTTIDAIAARWALDQPGVAAIILGVGSKSRAAKNVALSSLRLDNEDRQRIAAHLRSQDILPGDMYDLERDGDGPHSKIIKTDLHHAGGSQ